MPRHTGLADEVAHLRGSDAMLQGLAEPVVIDEWQEAPDVLGAVKRSVDEDPRPGRFILTGSVRAELENQVWPGTGRILQVPMYGLSVRERIGHAARAAFIDRVAAEGIAAVNTRPCPSECLCSTWSPPDSPTGIADW